MEHNNIDLQVEMYAALLEEDTDLAEIAKVCADIDSQEEIKFAEWSFKSGFYMGTSTKGYTLYTDEYGNDHAMRDLYALFKQQNP